MGSRGDRKSSCSLEVANIEPDGCEGTRCPMGPARNGSSDVDETRLGAPLLLGYPTPRVGRDASNVSKPGVSGGPPKRGADDGELEDDEAANICPLVGCWNTGDCDGNGGRAKLGPKPGGGAWLGRAEYDAIAGTGCWKPPNGWGVLGGPREAGGRTELGVGGDWIGAGLCPGGLGPLRAEIGGGSDVLRLGPTPGGGRTAAAAAALARSARSAAAAFSAAAFSRAACCAAIILRCCSAASRRCFSRRSSSSLA